MATNTYRRVRQRLLIRLACGAVCFASVTAVLGETASRTKSELHRAARLHEQGKYEQAKQTYRQELARMEEISGPMEPFYGVFDNFAFKVNGYDVTLLGQVTRPTLKKDAERVVKRIEGVKSVDDQIEVLPLSPNDDRIRLTVYRAIYGDSVLDRHALMAVPSIHIIVRNGNVTLEGAVAWEGDKNIANIQANSVPGAFSVTNNLRVDKEK